MTHDRVASVNMRGGLPPHRVEPALTRILEDTDLIGLQEWGPSRNGILHRAGTLVRAPRMARWLRHGPPVDGWVFTRPLRSGGPVGARGDRYQLHRVSSSLLARRGRVDKSPGRRHWLGPSRATVGIYDDRELGDQAVVINYHLTAEVQAHGHYRHDRPLRVARHQTEVRRLTRLAHRHIRKGRRVYVVGDSNFDGFRIHGLTSCWAGRKDPGTLGGRTVDGIHTTAPADSVRLAPSPSDHRPPIATYRRTP